MAGRRTNIALAGLLAVAAATGLVSYGIGTATVRVVLVLHGIAAVAIVALVPWKAAIVRRGLDRRRANAWLSIALALLVVVTIASGVAHSVFDAAALGRVSIMQIHVAAAILTILTAVAHMRLRPQRLRRADLDRRTFLRVTGLAAAAAVGYVVVERSTAAAGLPGAGRRFTGSHERGSHDPASMPVTSWLDDAPPERRDRFVTVRHATATTAIGIDDLAAYGDHVTATLDCTGGWYATVAWSGARLSRLLAPPSGSIRVISATGYERRFPAADADRLLLATHAEGEPLSAGHGAPVRLVAPGRRGFWWVKWVTDIVADDRPAWWQPPLPLS